MLAMTPPGPRSSSQRRNVAGTPTASMAVSTPRPPVRAITASAALPSALLMVWVAPNCRASPRRASSTSIMMIFRRRVELRRQQRGQADRPGADDRDRRAGRDLAIENPAFEAGRQDVTQHHQRFFVRAGWNWIEAGIGVGRADVLRLGSVDLVAEDPAARRTMGIHAAPAVVALAAR